MSNNVPAILRFSTIFRVTPDSEQNFYLLGNYNTPVEMMS